jgi:hypothetical protein
MSDRGYPQWDFSKAQEILNKMIDDNEHKKYKKKRHLWKSHEEFQLYPLKVFRDHVYQELKTRKYLYQLEVMGKQWKGTK